MFWYLLSPIFAEANWDTELLSIAVAIGMLPSAFNDTPAYLGSLTPIVNVFILFFFVEADVGCHQGRRVRSGGKCMMVSDVHV